MERIEMTAQEIELLTQAYQDADRIREGKLFSHQEEALRQIRAMIGYLDQKYPGHAFALVRFWPANKFTSKASLVVEDDGEYTVYAEATDSGYVCADNCYGKYLRPRYDQHMEQTLADGGYTGRSYTRFPSASDVLGQETTVEELLQQEPKLTRTVDLFIVAEDREAVAGDLQKRLTQAGLYGAYTVYFVSGLDDIQSLEDRRATLEYMVFSCFDI